MTARVHSDSATQTHERRFLSLGQWLFLLLSLFLVGPLCISNLWLYFQARRSLLAAASQNGRDVAALAASQVMLDVRSVGDLFAAAVSADRHLPDLVRRLSAADGNMPRRADDELRALRLGMSDITPVEEIQIISPTGALLISTNDGQAGARVAAPACIQARAYGPRLAGISYQERQPSLLFTSALKSDAGTRLGIVCARFRFNIHRQLIRAHRESGAQGALYLVNGRGEVIGDSFEDDQLAASEPPFRARGRTLPALDRPWEGRYVLDSGVETLAAYVPIPSLKWGVAVEVPVNVALAPLRRLKWEAAIAAGILGIMVIVGAFWSWRTVVLPLRSLSRTAERMAAGATGQTVRPGGSREIADLATAFNGMSVALWESQHSLEERIAERTRELRESREFAELLLNSINHEVIVVDRAYRIIKANAAAVRTYGLNLVGSLCYQAFAGRGTPCEQCAAARTFATGRSASEERSQLTSNGREAVEVETYPVLGADGQVESAIEIARTVSAEKQLQMQMMHQEKMAAFGLLAAGVAHDIGNPLAAIDSQLQLARQEPGHHDETLTVVSKEIARISRMLRELIDFARRRRDELTLLSANQVVEDVARLLSHDPRGRTVTITQNLAATLPGIRAKEDHLFQVLLNLGLNALDAMSGGGTLEFETRSRSGWIIVRVRDTGHGIPAALRERLFAPFFTTKTPERGTGLGLFVSKSIVESMGGELTLEHTDDRGTVFAIFLPVDASASGDVST